MLGTEADGDTRGVEVGIAEQGVESHGAAATPAPNAHPLRVEVGPGGQDVLQCRGLVLRRQDAHLSVDRFAPVMAARRGGSSVVETHHHIALLREHPVPELAGTAPLVLHGLSGWFAVHMDDEGVLLRAIELRGQHAPAIDFDAVTHRNPKELRGGHLQSGEFFSDLLVVGQHPNGLVVGQGNELGLRRHGERRHRVEGPTPIG